MSGIIYSKIPQVMADVPVIGKQHTHEQQKWKYRSANDFLNAFQPVLTKHGLFVVPEVLGTESGVKATKNSQMNFVIVTVAYSLFAEDGSMIRAVVVGESWDAQDNSCAKAMKDAFRTFLEQTFCVAVGQDEAAIQSTDNRSAQQTRQQVKPKQNQAQTQPAAKVNEIADWMEQRAAKLIQQQAVSKNGAGYIVADGRGQFTVTNKTCTCPRFQAAKKCEHVLAVEKLAA